MYNKITSFIQTEKNEVCLEYIEKATKYDIQYDMIDINKKLKSKLFNILDFSKYQVSMSDIKNLEI